MKHLEKHKVHSHNKVCKSARSFCRK